MPLEPGDSRKAIGKNIGTELATGKPRKQAIAMSLFEARRTGHGHIPPPPKKYGPDPAKPTAPKKRLPHPVLAALKRHVEYKRYCKECGCS